MHHHQTQESLNIMVDSQNRDGIALQIETAELIQNDSELTSLQLQQQSLKGVTHYIEHT